MSWAATSTAPEGESLQQFELQSPQDPELLDERGAVQLALAAAAADDLVRSLREEAGYGSELRVHAYGHAQPEHGAGDTLTVQVSVPAVA